MSPTRNLTHSTQARSKSRLKDFAKWFEPYGILIAVVALIVAIGTLWLELDLRKTTLAVFSEERELRKKTLEALAAEEKLRKKTLEAIEADDLLREATLLSIVLERLECRTGGESLLFRPCSDL